ncbi:MULTISPECIES: RluA family pseudouridine synthase [Shewanella]|mgnify:FL=1|jgi:tRNA pseudouridine32 synthase/23S rRNA pseudouridine746 synthase|uniref:RluA family pseudouridine synthase n=1 Tax=Shewanella TaxID=22 RepID=UPI00200E1373|nr:pseudouridine synthase [Shewanella basaltis]MCL1113324.1 pseudouridine synthase [Shewanella basaltis]
MSEFIAPPCHGVIEVLYQDEHILLINKPSGLLSLSGKHPLNKDSVHYRLVQDFPSATLLHRLDFGTSGIMLVALNKQVNGLLTQQFQQRTVSKSYTAVLHGMLATDEGEIDLPIAKDDGNFPLMKICHQTGKPAHSHYRVISRTNSEEPQQSSTKVAFSPITGRTHQLRIHSLFLGHPILGCDLYRNAVSQQMSARLLLHATTLTFTHPVTFETMKGICPSPF